MRITLLTDFGTADGYVAAMKGVIAVRAPGVPIDDASHDVPPGDVLHGAWALSVYWNLYSPGTVHVAVVDPGVGTARRALAARVDGRFVVAPDNGLLSRVLDVAGEAEVVAVTSTRFMRDVVSGTFHGRDIFAPVAAHLATGTPLLDLGHPVSDPVRIARAAPFRTPGGARGHVVHVDRFGNLITDLPEAWVAGAAGVRVAGRDVGPVRRTFADVGPGELVALIGSAGLLEIAVRDGSAAAAMGIGRGAPVEVGAGMTEAG